MVPPLGKCAKILISIISFTVSRISNPRHFCYFLNDDPVVPHSFYKYPGTHLTDNLSWAVHIQHVISKANRTLGFLRQYPKLAPPHLKLRAFRSLARPKPEHATFLRHPRQLCLINNIEAVQNMPYVSFISTTLKK